MTDAARDVAPDDTSLYPGRGDPYESLRHLLTSDGSRWATGCVVDALRVRRASGATTSEKLDDEAWGDYPAFDPFPRVLGQSDWTRLSAGLEQRARALNLFLRDAYRSMDIVRAGLIPEDILRGSAFFEPLGCELPVPAGQFVPLWGMDVVKTRDNFHVLEDNAFGAGLLGTQLALRALSQRVMGTLCGRDVMPLDEVGPRLRRVLAELSPRRTDDPCIVLLSAREFRGLYFEHCLLARSAGIELVEAEDLFIEDAVLFLKTTSGPRRVDVAYQRMPAPVRADSGYFRSRTPGVMGGLLDVVHAGNLGLASAVGADLAGDKAIYRYVPQMIEFYLGQSPLLDNVPTYLGALPSELDHIISHVHELVTKPRALWGGKGVLIGPHATKDERRARVDELRSDPGAFVAQPVVNFNTLPWISNGPDDHRYADIRTFVLCGEQAWASPGGVTRVAPPGSMLTNVSGAGGIKDTWVLRHG